MSVAFRFRSALAPILVFLLTAALPAVANEGVAVFSDPSRIASTGGSITEVVHALGEESDRLARGSTSHPKAALKLPTAGYMRQPSPEDALPVNPSVVLALYGSGPKNAVAVPKKSNVSFIEALQHSSHEGMLGKVRVVGQGLGVKAKAETLAAEMDLKQKPAGKQTSSIKERKRIPFALSTKGGKILALGTSTARDGIKLPLCQRPRVEDKEPCPPWCPIPLIAPAVLKHWFGAPTEPGRPCLLETATQQGLSFERCETCRSPAWPHGHRYGTATESGQALLTDGWRAYARKFVGKGD
ncbi:ABC transporter substrate-binding protein [Mesorhizobium sp. WSM2239]|uniref:ABC transporter substrate-binding protein n=2 Tax=unclassified Mesorhizobium TaxID=325217 RepID=A0AAU8D8M9_9HYPH